MRAFHSIRFGPVQHLSAHARVCLGSVCDTNMYHFAGSRARHCTINIHVRLCVFVGKCACRLNDGNGTVFRLVPLDLTAYALPHYTTICSVCVWLSHELAHHETFKFMTYTRPLCSRRRRPSKPLANILLHTMLESTEIGLSVCGALACVFMLWTDGRTNRAVIL